MKNLQKKGTNRYKNNLKEIIFIFKTSRKMKKIKKNHMSQIQRVRLSNMIVEEWCLIVFWIKLSQN